MSEAPTPPRPETLRELGYLFTFLRPYRKAFIAAIIASMVSMSFGALFPWLVGELVDASIPSVKVELPSSWKPTINTVGALLITTLLIQSVLTFFSSMTFQRKGERAVADLRHQLFSRIVALPMRFFGERRVGELSSRMSNDLAQIQDLFAYAVPSAVRQVMLFLAGAVAITLTSWKLSLVMVASLPPVVLMTVWFGRKVRKLSREAQDRLAESATIVEESLQNVASVKAYGNEAYEQRRYATALDRFIDVIIPTARLRAGLIGFVITGMFGSITLVLWYGAHLMARGDISHGELTRFTMYTLLIGGSVAGTAEIVAAVNKSLGASQRVRELFREEPEAIAPPGVQPPRLAGDVQFENVHFRYPSRPDVEVLRGLTLHAAPGEKIALVGPSGAGKSTIVSLLLRFYEPDSGRFLIDGKPANALDLATVRGNMAIVPQEVMLFGGSIRDNISYGRPGASDDDIQAAARRANCHEFIEKFPEAYNTLVGERGVKLSGGQRQRIAIARALLKDPAILILDEATSSLDSESERLIQDALETLLEGRTAFIIAHRLSTVRQVDRIYVIEDGIAAESGTHEELIEREGGTYRRLSELQFSV